jgi:putative transposase
MPNTYTSLHYHLVFSTKDRFPLIQQHWRERMHAYLGGTVRTLEGVPDEIGGTADHVHLLVGLKPTHRLSDVLREIKRESSIWAHEEIGASKFAWQEGYGAFTVSVSQLPSVRDYIARQEEHHRKRTFREEYIDLLRRHGVRFDEKYLW